MDFEIVATSERSGRDCIRSIRAYAHVWIFYPCVADIHSTSSKKITAS